MPTESAAAALAILRDGSLFHMKTVKSKAITVGSIFAVNAVCALVFGVILKWI